VRQFHLNAAKQLGAYIPPAPDCSGKGCKPLERKADYELLESLSLALRKSVFAVFIVFETEITGKIP